MKKIKKHSILVLVFIALFSCVEEIDFIQQEETFESALVIEATITNELKQQQIILSRTFPFEEEGPIPESGATVTIESSQGLINFSETEPGIYLSNAVFAAQNTVDYQLKIIANNGRLYSSKQVQLTKETAINNLYAIRDNNDSGVNGMSIYIDSHDPTGNSKYYRYTYEETYKIIAPKWTPEEIVLTDPLICEVWLQERTQEEKVCYNTVHSSNINLVNTSGLSEDRVTKHLVRFIDSEDFILTWRYSINVKQYIQSLDAYTYYKTLEEFSGEGSIFSQTQPGFISGNISSETNSEEKVVGFFDVSTVSEKRIFFNYEDFYPDEPQPSFPTFCEPRLLDQYSFGGGCGALISDLLQDKVAYWGGASKVPDTIFSVDGGIIRIDTITIGPYNMVTRPCGDCTAIGSNIVPDFWEE